MKQLADKSLLKSLSYIDGNWVGSEDGIKITITNPADGEALGEVSSMSAKDSSRATEAAQRAFQAWSNRLPQERSKILRHWYELIREAKEDLAIIMTLEQGKPITEARGEIDYASDFIEFYSEESKRLNIESVTSHLVDAEMEVWLEPVGVAALITPWNFPAAMLTRKAAAALATGCTIVVHPSSETPFSALALVELANRAGFPKGVINVVTGKASTVVPPWCQDPRIRVLSFTGSTEVGHLLYKQCSNTIKKLIMELGGHAPAIIFNGCDINKTVNDTIKAKFATSGQDCLAANRIYIEQPIYEEFCRRFTKATQALTIGVGLDDKDIGPLMNEESLKKQELHVKDALEKGAKLLCGGKRHELGSLFFEPTVLADVSHDAVICNEETFGPVAALMPFNTEDEVIRLANNTKYGLVAYIHSEDPRQIYRVTKALEFGMISVNRTKVTGSPIPFGGVKQSGLGREGSRFGLEAFTEIKYVCRDWTRER